MTIYDPIVGDVCGCDECVAAGVATERMRRDPDTKQMVHGWALRRGLDAFGEFQRMARAAIGAKGRHCVGFERLAKREPGEEG